MLHLPLQPVEGAKVNLVQTLIPSSCGCQGMSGAGARGGHVPGLAVPFGHVVPFQLRASVSPPVKQGELAAWGMPSMVSLSAGPLGLS